MIKSVVFDFDHTLYDRDATYENMLDSFMTFFADFLRPDISREEVLSTIQRCDRTGIYKAPHWEAIYADTVESGIFRKEPTYSVYYNDYIEQNYPQAIAPYTDTIPMMDLLHSRGLKLGILTNGPVEYQRAKIVRMGLDQHVDLVVVGDELPHPKPHPTSFAFVCEQLDCLPEETMYVGDHPINDVDGARRAGLIGVWFRSVGIWLPRVKPAQYAIDELSQIPDLVEELNRR